MASSSCLWLGRQKRWLAPTKTPWQLPLFMAEQRATLVNVKLKWVKDRALDSVVARERHLRAAHHLLDLISSQPYHRIPAHQLLSHNSVSNLLGPADASLAFLRRYSTLFIIRPRWFSLTDAALLLRQRELRCLRHTEPDLISRLRRLLMLTLPRTLPLHTVDLLRWDLGLPTDYRRSLLPRYPDLFGLVQPPGDDRVWLRLLSWDDGLAVSELQKSASGNADPETACLPFPLSFTRGYGLSNKCMAWLREWQALPYTSPYADASALDPRTDISEKRNVGVFHELLHLTVAKKTERRNVSNMRKLLGMPQKFTKVFERHPGIFYLSQLLGTQTVVLREAYGGGSELLSEHAHPLVAIREEYAAMMRAALPPRRSRSRPASRCNQDEEEDEGGEANFIG